MRDLVERSARDLRAGCGAFTRDNLFYAVRRRSGTRMDGARFDRLLRARLAERPVQGLLPASPPSWRPRRLGREWDAYFPAAILLVDRPSILHLFVASGVIAQARLAVVCLDGTPATVVSWLRRGFRAKRTAPVAYLHDARTVVFPFAFEPLLTFVEEARGPIPFRDLGLPPLGQSAAAFRDASLPPDERVFELEALPPAALIAYVAREVRRMIPGDPNMLPLAQPSDTKPRTRRKSGAR